MVSANVAVPRADVAHANVAHPVLAAPVGADGRAFNPNHPQPYHVWSLAIGIPAAIFGTAATMALTMAVTHGYAAEGWLGIGAIWTAYAGVMGVLWVATAAE